MTGWVVDSSIALAWGLPDEGSPTADLFWEEVQSGVELHVPPLWWYECANALVVARRRERVTEEQAGQLGILLGSLPVITAASPAGADLARLQILAARHGLSAYDAAYLDLARGLMIGLASLDARLSDAARAEGIEAFSA